MGHGPSSVPRWTGRHNEARSSARRIAKVFPLGAVRHRHPFRPAAEYPGKDRTVRDGRRTSWHGIVSKAGTRPSSKVKARPEGRNQTSEDFPFRPRAESISIGGMNGYTLKKKAVSWALLSQTENASYRTACSLTIGALDTRQGDRCRFLVGWISFYTFGGNVRCGPFDTGLRSATSRRTHVGCIMPRRKTGVIGCVVLCRPWRWACGRLERTLHCCSL